MENINWLNIIMITVSIFLGFVTAINQLFDLQENLNVSKKKIINKLLTIGKTVVNI